jgi:membrane protease YdiL (CAAX protease family)
MLAARPALTPRDMRQWIAMSRAGWMQGYLVTLHSVSLPTSVSLTVAYVAVEEIVFRGIMITFLLPLGAVAAVTLSTIVFAIVQAFQMPGWRNAIFPATGAVVMGIVHGTLFVAVPDVAPLIVAHAVFFLAAVL